MFSCQLQTASITTSDLLSMLDERMNIACLRIVSPEGWEQYECVRANARTVLTIDRRSDDSIAITISVPVRRVLSLWLLSDCHLVSDITNMLRNTLDSAVVLGSGD
jgi:hypothetical protein